MTSTATSWNGGSDGRARLRSGEDHDLPGGGSGRNNRSGPDHSSGGGGNVRRTDMTHHDKGKGNSRYSGDTSGRQNLGRRADSSTIGPTIRLCGLE